MLLFLILLVISLIFTALYFIPSFIAIGRKHSHVLQITILNTFLGWSFIAWVAALIWATTDYIDKDINTNGSKIIILVCFLTMLIPIILLSLVPRSELKRTIHETQYHKDYKLKSGQVVREYVQTRQIEYKN